MMPPMNSDCVMHAQELHEMKKDIKEIRDSLLGTFEGEGFISKIDKRVTALESFKRVYEWTTGSIVVAFLGGLAALIAGKV